MKKQFPISIFCALCAILLGACHNKSEEVSLESVNYTFNGFSVETGSLNELTTRAAEAEATYSLLAIDVKDGGFVQSISRVQVPESEALADVTMPLRVGSHKIYILCSSQPWHNVDESALLVSWNEQTAYLGDVWSAVVDVTVQSGDAQTKSVSLSRAVAFVRTMVMDALPANIAKFRQTLVGGSWSFNLAQQSGDVAAQITRSLDIPSAYVGHSGVGVGIYTFVPSGATAATSYNLTALDSQGATIQSVSFANVPIEVNRYTTYQGNYFGYNTNFQVSLQNDWNDQVVIPF